jgi:hypothetical protein
VLSHTLSPALSLREREKTKPAQHLLNVGEGENQTRSATSQCGRGRKTDSLCNFSMWERRKTELAPHCSLSLRERARERGV